MRWGSYFDSMQVTASIWKVWNRSFDVVFLVATKYVIRYSHLNPIINRFPCPNTALVVKSSFHELLWVAFSIYSNDITPHLHWSISPLIGMNRRTADKLLRLGKNIPQFNYTSGDICAVQQLSRLVDVVIVFEWQTYDSCLRWFQAEIEWMSVMQTKKITAIFRLGFPSSCDLRIDHTS